MLHDGKDEIDWEKVHVGLHRTSGNKINLFVGSGKRRNDGTIDFDVRSPYMTDEIVKMVAYKLKCELDNRTDGRLWHGYTIPGIGKLVLIKPGFDFDVKFEVKRWSERNKKKRKKSGK